MFTVAVVAAQALPRAEISQIQDFDNAPTSAGQDGDRFNEFDWRLCKVSVLVPPLSPRHGVGLLQHIAV